MSDFREPQIVIEEIKGLDEVVASLLEVSRLYPEDKVTVLTLEQSNSRKQILVAELEQALAHYGYNSLRVACKTEGRVEVAYLARLFDGLRESLAAVAKTFDKKFGDFPLYLDALYHSSYGMAFSTKPEDKLIRETCGQTISQLIFVLNLMKRGVYSQYNAVNTKIFDLLRSIQEDGNAVEVVYSGAYGKDGASVGISREDTGRIITGLSEATVSRTERVIIGVIQGINLLDMAMIVVPREKAGVKLKIIFEESHTDAIKEALGELREILVMEETADYKHINKSSETRTLVRIQNLGQ